MKRLLLTIFVIVMISILILCLGCVPDERDTSVDERKTHKNQLTENDAEGFEWKHNYNEITITGYHGNSADLVIPSEIEGKPVTEIMGDKYGQTGGAFYGFKSLKSIVIPNSVRTIGHNAFRNCESLRSIIIPEGVEEIDDYAFANCTSLKSVTLPKSICRVGSDVFLFCDNIEEVHYSGTLRQWFDLYGSYLDGSSFNGWIYTYPCEYGAKLFIDGQELKNLTIPDGIDVIPNKVFFGCSSIVEVIIPEGVYYIGDGAFAKCYNIKRISIPISVNVIGVTDIALPAKDYKPVDSLTIYYEGSQEKWDNIKKWDYKSGTRYYDKIKVIFNDKTW